MVVIRYFRKPGLSEGQEAAKLKKLQNVDPSINTLTTELCYNIELASPINEELKNKLLWILSSPFRPEQIKKTTQLNIDALASSLVEIGPRLNFSTAWSSNAVSICKSVGIDQVTRLEVSTRYLIGWNKKTNISLKMKENLAGELHDRMTQCVYEKPIETFQLSDSGTVGWYEVDILKKGKAALQHVSNTLGLAFDDWDIDFYTDLFKNKLKRNPTSVECFDLAQSNSEHSRHWFFKGKMVIDEEEKDDSLLDMIIKTQETSNPNNVIKFSDNSSAIKGFGLRLLKPTSPSEPSPLVVDNKAQSDIIFTAETHNFPTGVAPFSGATTGTGGRLRDIQGVGRGGSYIAGTAGYSVGNLLIPGYDLPWESKEEEYPPNLATPLEIIVEASNGASDYGNKFGEPVLAGFARTFGIVDPLTNERREWIKPIMFSAGLGFMDSNMTEKERPEKGMQIVKLGGPVYRIGVGGGAASSVQVQGDNASELDFGAVQRGDAEMEQKLQRVIKACVEMGPQNPICSIHDQGAGGNGNVLKELVEPMGAVIFSNRFTLGDPTINTLELWGAEYQENDAVLVKDLKLLKEIAKRERCPLDHVGVVLDTGRIILSEEPKNDFDAYMNGTNDKNKRHPVDLDLELVLGKMPRKTFTLERRKISPKSLVLPSTLSIPIALDRVIRLPSVASKRYLTNKVDRCVTGLVAQQQCVGPLHTPLSDVAVTALSHFDKVGAATSIGEQPIKGLISPGAGARMSVGEALTNLAAARISTIKDVKCSGNWMWAAKLPGEGAALYDACEAMCDVMHKLGIAIDGGKDSLSMAARVGKDTVKAPGTLVVSCYAPCPDITLVVTPDLKGPKNNIDEATWLIHVDLAPGKARLGGSALAQCYKQLGDESPDLDDPQLLLRTFNVLQKLIEDNLIVSMHDISDGGLIICILEMAFAGMRGFNVNVEHNCYISPLQALFSEELGWIIEVDAGVQLDKVEKAFIQADIHYKKLGRVGPVGMKSEIKISVNGRNHLGSNVASLFARWEETSYHLERRQTNIDCAIEEFQCLGERLVPKYEITFDVNEIPSPAWPVSSPPCVAVIREEGTNGDREMAAACIQAGFEVWDVTMQDLLDKHVTTDRFRGIIFPGGFSYADVLGSAKGWAASLRFHPNLRKQMDAFVQREDTFSLGVCNGCQLMGLLGWISSPGTQKKDSDMPDVILTQNKSERFECRWSTIRVETSKSIMLQNMTGTTFGIWIAHGEGRFEFRNSQVAHAMSTGRCFALNYVDEYGDATEKYPLNPNGSPGGLAGVCSPDGRHLAMMPHPERCTQMWQCPWQPDRQPKTMGPSPWARMFRNAYVWSCEHGARM